MSQIANLLSKLREAANGIAEEVHELDAKIADLHAQRNKIVGAAVSKEDYLAYVAETLRRKGNTYAIALQREAKNLPSLFGELEKYMKTSAGLRLPVFTGSLQVPTPITEEALCFLFGEQVLARVSDALNGLNWPENAMPVAERRKAISVIENELAEMESKRSALVAQLNQSGVTG